MSLLIGGTKVSLSGDWVITNDLIQTNAESKLHIACFILFFYFNTALI